jgi:hypothetical protein
MASRGDGSIKISADALSYLDDLRPLLGRPIHLSSAYRSPYRNAACGVTPKPAHLAGIAFDVRLRGHDKEERCVRKIIIVILFAPYLRLGSRECSKPLEIGTLTNPFLLLRRFVFSIRAMINKPASA